jgi:hypothetical protein
MRDAEGRILKKRVYLRNCMRLTSIVTTALLTAMNSVSMADPDPYQCGYENWYRAAILSAMIVVAVSGAMDTILSSIIEADLYRLARNQYERQVQMQNIVGMGKPVAAAA